MPQLTSNNTSIDLSPAAIDAICRRLLDSEEHAVESAIPPVAEDAVAVIRRLSMVRNEEVLVAPLAEGYSFAPFELVIESYACDQHGPGPAFCRVTVDPAFIQRLDFNSKLCSERNMESVEVDRRPDSWDCEDALQISGNALHISNDSFWFVAYPKHTSYHVETRLMDIADLKEIALQGEKSGLELASTFKWSDGKLYYTGDDIDDFVEMAFDRE